ncbi:MAG TPA: GEVED domain-containing protein, partial [Roseiflexaceae bacterium]|nr:GEVED domain-containing protein [Roseiflexaceae bacterium]
MRRTTPRRSLIALVMPILLLGMASSASGAPPTPPIMEFYRAANFMVVYNPPTCQQATSPWTPEAQAALNHTADILNGLVNSGPTITIEACFEDSDPSTLASAGPTGFVDQAQVPALPLPNVDYPIALANAISGVDNNGDTAEISLSVNRTVNWNYATGLGTTSGAQFDFVSTALHELLHGLGFLSTANSDTNGITFGDNGRFFIFDTFMVTSNGTALTSLPANSQAVVDALQAGSGNLQWNGPNATAANSGARPTLFAPNPFQQGSSGSHLDDDDPQNAGRLMNAATDAGPGSHTPSAVTLMILKDMGWPVNDASDHGDLPAGYPVSAAEDGPRHIRDGLMLGASITTEGDGVPGPTANSDGGDDGIAMTTPWQNGANGGAVQVAVNGARGCLSAWIDWNGNHSFNDAGDQISAMQAMQPGTQTLQINVPDGTFDGASGVSLFARFRLAP